MNKVGPLALELTVQAESGGSRVSRLTFPDELGRLSVGYGHVLAPGENVNLPLSLQSSFDLLLADFKALERGILFGLPNMAQHQFDAVACLAYHVHQGRCQHAHKEVFAESTMLKRIRNSEFQLASAEFDNWVYLNTRFSRRFAVRRNREKYLFSYGHFPSL